jgi:hypothetical protein
MASKRICGHENVYNVTPFIKIVANVNNTIMYLEISILAVNFMKQLVGNINLSRYYNISRYIHFSKSFMKRKRKYLIQANVV